MNSILREIIDTHNLRKSGSRRWVGRCPDCGGSATSDRFQVWDDGGYKCYGCGISGDMVTWLRERRGMSCGEAHQELGKDCTRTTCPVYSTCRMGDGSGRNRPRRPQVFKPDQRSHQARTLPVQQPIDPVDTWRAWAGELVDKAASRLRDEKVLSWLSQRGIDAIAVSRFRIGWLPHQYQVSCKQLGIPDRPGKTDDKLWVPDGLLIPVFDDHGVHRIRVRRTRAARDRFLPERKYEWLRGSGNRPLVIRPADKCRGAVIVEAELDGFAVAAAHDEVMVVSIGTVAMGVPADLMDELASLPVILVALDADQAGKDGRPPAGPVAVKRWLARFRRAKYWPVPAGKDPGELASAGGDLYAWIEAGLPPRIHADRLSSGRLSQGDNGVPAEQVPEKMTYALNLRDGRTVLITKDPGEWQRLVKEGRVVFSHNELLRLKSACRALDSDEAALMVDRVLELKEVFGGAYIRKGGTAA